MYPRWTVVSLFTILSAPLTAPTLSTISLLPKSLPVRCISHGQPSIQQVPSSSTMALSIRCLIKPTATLLVSFQDKTTVSQWSLYLMSPYSTVKTLSMSTHLVSRLLSTAFNLFVATILLPSLPILPTPISGVPVPPHAP